MNNLDVTTTPSDTMGRGVKLPTLTMEKQK